MDGKIIKLKKLLVLFNLMQLIFIFVFKLHIYSSIKQNFSNSYNKKLNIFMCTLKLYFENVVSVCEFYYFEAKKSLFFQVDASLSLSLSLVIKMGNLKTHYYNKCIYLNM